jgi:hypothetical protein
MAFLLLPNESIRVGGWGGLDGKSFPFAVDNDGFWADIPIIDGSDPRQKIHYAIRITTNYTDKTDEDIGLVDGVFRLITDKPDYDGSTQFPTWGNNENQQGVVLYKWFTGILVKDSLGNLSRSIDITTNGNYGNISNFSFSLRNDIKFWKILKDLEMTLINENIEVFAVIDDKFYQLWNGVISEVIRESTDYKVICSDNSNIIHSLLPKNFVGDILQPFVVGNSDYLKASKITESNYIQLTENSNFAPIRRFDCVEVSPPYTGTLDNITQVDVSIITTGKTFTENELQGKYLSVHSIKHNPLDTLASDRELVEDAWLYIYESWETVKETSSEYMVTKVRIKQPPLVNPPFEDATVLSYYRYDSLGTDDETKVFDYFMYVAVQDIQNKYVVAQSGTDYNLNDLYYYDEDSLSYIKLPIQGIDNGDGTFNVLNTLPTQRFELPLNYRLRAANVATSYQIGEASINPTPTTTNLIYDVNALRIENENGYWFRITTKSSYNIVPVYEVGEVVNIFVKLYNTNIFPSDIIIANCRAEVLSRTGASTTTRYTLSAVPNDQDFLYFDNSDSDDSIFLNGELIFQDLESSEINIDGNFTTVKDTLTNKNPAVTNFIRTRLDRTDESQSDFYITLDDEIKDDDDVYITADFSREFFWNTTDFYVEWAILDNFGKEIIFTDVTDYAQVRLEWVENADNIGLLGLPDTYYNTNALDGRQIRAHTNFYSVLEPEGFGFNLFKLPDEFKKKIIDGLSKNIRLTIGMNDPNKPWTNLKIHQIGCFISRPLTLDKDIFVKSTNLSTTIDQSTVYNTFKSMLEAHDGIPTSNIDYGNLSATRSIGDNYRWLAGRVFTEQKNTRDYLIELCAHTFVAMFSDRKGKLKLNAWLEDNELETWSHDNIKIVRDSIKSINSTSMNSVFSSYLLEYNFDYGTGKFNRFIKLDRTDEDITFPTSAEDWSSFVDGIADYGLSKLLWESAREGYLLAGAKNSPSDFLNKLNYFREYHLSDDYNSPLNYLVNLINYNSRQKLTTDYEIPITSASIETELTEKVLFKNRVYTDDSVYNGWITDIVYDLKNDKIKVSTLLIPDDTYTDIVLPDIPEPPAPEIEQYLYDAQGTDRTDYINIDAIDDDGDRSNYNIIDAEILDRTELESL